MFRLNRKNKLRGGLYHLALILITSSAFNWGFWRLTEVNLAERLFAGFIVPDSLVAIAICVSAVVVLWNNWVD